jgi:hypothetical protein
MANSGAKRLNWMEWSGPVWGDFQQQNFSTRKFKYSRLQSNEDYLRRILSLECSQRSVSWKDQRCTLFLFLSRIKEFSPCTRHSSCSYLCLLLFKMWVKIFGLPIVLSYTCISLFSFLIDINFLTYFSQFCLTGCLSRVWKNVHVLNMYLDKICYRYFEFFYVR